MDVSKQTLNILVSSFKIKSRETISAALKIGVNVGSYTLGRIAGDFLSSRKAA